MRCLIPWTRSLPRTTPTSSSTRRTRRVIWTWQLWNARVAWVRGPCARLVAHIRQGPRGLRWCVPFPITGIHVLTWFHEYRPTVVLLASMLIRHARGSTGNAAAFLGKTRVGWRGRSRVRARPNILMPAKRPCQRRLRDADKEPGRTGRSRLSFVCSIPSRL